MTTAAPTMQLTEVVLRTARFDEMRAWYVWFLDRTPFLEREPDPGSDPVPAGQQERAADVRLAFIAVHGDHPYTQILALFGIPGAGTEPATGPGLHHFRWSVAGIDELVAQYERLAERGVLPHRAANHGQATSFYYRDPDQNITEVSCANFATAAEEMAFLASDAFRANPSGLELDAAEFVDRFRSGTPTADLLRIP